MTFFLNATIDLRDPEERPKGASRRTYGRDPSAGRFGLTCLAPLFKVGAGRNRGNHPKPDMSEILSIAIIAMVLLLGALALWGSRLLLGWYLREVRGLKIAPAPGEAIVTYPMA